MMKPVLKKRLKVLTFCWSICAMILSGCSDQMEEYSSAATVETIAEMDAETEGVEVPLVYELTEIEFDLEFYPHYIATNGKDIYWCKQDNESDQPMNIIMHSTTDDPEFKPVCEYPQIEIPVDDTDTISMLNQILIAPDGKFALSFMKDWAQKREVILCDQTGQELGRVAYDLAPGAEDVLLCTTEYLCIPMNNEIVVFDYQGVEQKRVTVDIPKEQKASVDLSKCNGMYQLEDGRVFVSYPQVRENGRVFVGIDLTTGEITEIGQTLTRYEYYVGYGTKYDFIVKNDKGLLGWNVEETKQTRVADFEESGINPEMLRCVACIEGKLLVRNKNPQIDGLLLYLTKVDPDQVKERKVITIGIFENEGLYVDLIASFNQIQKKYLVRVVDYTKYRDEKIERLNLDLGTGNAPDILYFGSALAEVVPIESYAKQNLLEDLKVWFENDPEIDEDEYLLNIFESHAVNGGWYQLPTKFEIATYMGKTSIVGSDHHWTTEDMDALQKQYPESLVMGVAREVLMRDALITRWNEFVNEEENTCSFDSVEFKELLTWLKGCPSQENMPADVREKTATRTDKVLVNRAELWSFGDFNTIPPDAFSPSTEVVPTTLLGFPDAKENGAVIQYRGISVAMTASCEYKQGAWDFIRYYLSEDSGLSGLSVKKTELKEVAEIALTEVGGRRDHYDANIQPPTQEMVDAWIEYISTATYGDMLDEELYNIIIEESGAFFAGQKSVEEVVGIIQNRVWIYLAE